MSNQQPMTEGGIYEEIDLRPYIQALLDKWYWIVGAGVIAALLALGASFLRSPSYEATALVAITEPRFNIRFDPRLETTDRATVSSQVYAELALSDDVVQALYEELTSVPEGVASAFDLRELLTAVSGSDASLLRLTATDSNPQVAAQLANQWADVFLQRATEIYGIQGDAPLAFLELQLATSATEVENAEQALITYQEQNPARLLTSQLRGYENALNELIKQQQTARAIRQEVLTLRTQLANQSTANVSPAEGLTALLLQLQSYGLNTEPGLQLVVDTDTDLFALTRAEQIAFLDDLAAALADKQGNLVDEIALLDPEIRAVQRQLQEVEAEQNRLTTSRNIAQETYTTLARTVAEARISSQDTTGQIQLASRAAVPVEPASSGRILITALALFLGAMLMIVFILGRAWWLAGQVQIVTRE